MNTPSHLIINAALRKGAGGRGLVIPRSAFLLGAVLPDVPLWLLWPGAYLYYRYMQGDPTVTLFDPRIDSLYFSNAFWIASHNLLHSPTLLLLVLAALWRFNDRPETRGGWWFWFAAGCLIHSLIDIATHVDDGPLLFFPFEWSLRFYSPLSYWDSRYYGREFGIFELLLNLILLIYLFGPGLWRRLRRRGAAPLEQ